MLFARGPYRDFDILAEGGEKGHQALDGEIAGAVAHQQRYLRLGNADDVAGLRLGQLTGLDDAVDVQGEARLELLLFGIREAKVGMLQ